MADPSTSTAPQDAVDASTVDRAATYRTIAWRVMPLLVICYIVSFIDRTNIGIAQHGLERDLGFGSAVYGLGVTLFFVGFILFEVPSSALLARLGARKTLVRIMVSWGVVTLATSLVHNEITFYVARFLLGVTEAGFFPGALYFLSRWFPSARRTRMTAVFFAGVPVSGVLGSLMSGAIMKAFDGGTRIADWQWLFIIEGIPPILLAGAVLLWLVDEPEQARWLTPAQRAAVRLDLDADQQRKKAEQTAGKGHGGLLLALRDPKVWIIGLCACGAYTLANAVSFWTPRIIADAGVGDVLDLGFFSALPPLFGIVVMLIVGRHSDRTLERRWHAALSWTVAALAMVAISVSGDDVAVVVVLLAILAAAHYSGLTVFYSIPSIYLSERAAATGIALVTSMGSFAAAASPSLLGFIQASTGSLSLGLQISAGIVLLAVVLLLVGVKAKDLREQRPS
ncbi:MULTISPECIES: MFS transporter [unclassified Streptomyces]|uniref:MFS transporter n=1 Tax=unclassified Streptomyces TaxID=2593676 RepID=UPI00224CD122|nr:MULTISPECIES: MFS transporter [unclassified Streptomyces]MCX4791778.1 MFS transporter [Streptomyces sp. NBC_01221]MCX4799393.1 MFS transporter [Streptomyces sp. NBC_01242]WSJ40737.1 MFS transporter [Streptomyces sp. NBC_01321]WSP60575.1 MFS transporter [Streptomyces sp. NBC_01240]WSP67111.1 MFS transporter [Streptomyces sp. NBC_01240]